MNLKVDEKLDHLLEKFRENPKILRYQELQEILLKDKKLSKNLQKFHTLDKYDPSYLEMKRELFQNPLYKEYLSLHQEITYWTYEMSEKLKKVAGSDNHENH